MYNIELSIPRFRVIINKDWITQYSNFRENNSKNSNKEIRKAKLRKKLLEIVFGENGSGKNRDKV